MFPINRKTIGTVNGIITLTAGAVLFLGKVIVQPLFRRTRQFQKEASQQKSDTFR